MIKIKEFILFLILAFIAHLFTWLQVNIQFINPKYKNSIWLILAGLPLAWLWMKMTQYGVESFGKYWPQRFIAFSIGIALYTILTNKFFNESLDMKSIICLILCFCIVGIQIIWK